MDKNKTLYGTGWFTARWAYTAFGEKRHFTEVKYFYKHQTSRSGWLGWSSRWEERGGGRTEAGQWNKWKRVWQSSPFSNQISHSWRLEYSTRSPLPSSSSTSSLSSLSDDQFIKKWRRKRKRDAKKHPKRRCWGHRRPLSLLFLVFHVRKSPQVSGLMLPVRFSRSNWYRVRTIERRREEREEEKQEEEEEKREREQRRSRCGTQKRWHLCFGRNWRWQKLLTAAERNLKG